MEKLTKKKSRVIVFLKRSETIQFILGWSVVVLSLIADYWLAKWECSLVHLGINDGYDIAVFLLMLGNIVGLILLFSFFLIVKYAVIASLTEWTRKSRVLNNYCYIPLTENEVRSFGFASAGEYFNYVVSAMYYGNRDKEKKDWINYVQLDTRDLQKMLAVCLKLFPDNGTIFGMEKNDYSCICNMYCKHFVQFLDAYHKTYENDRSYLPSASINETGNVILSVLNADGHGIAWTGKEMRVFTEENE